MTRGAAPDGEIDYRCDGAPGADRVVVVLRTGALATVDPDPAVTAHHDVWLVLVHLESPELDDPPAYGGETPAGSTAAAIGGIVDREAGPGPFGLVAERGAAALALSVAAALGDRVDRLAVVAAPVPASPLERDLAAPVFERISAPTLVLGAEGDADAGEEAARWHRDLLPDARAELIVAGDVHAPDGRLSLGDVWERVLSHVAPDTTRS